MALNLKNQKISATTDRFDEPILSFIPAQLKEYSAHPENLWSYA